MFKVGDKVMVGEMSGMLLGKSPSGFNYVVSFTDGSIRYVKPENLTPVTTPTDYRDLASVVKPTPFDWATSYDSVPILPQLRSGLAQKWNGKEWEWIKNPVSATPTTTKIIHNGTTTITQFNDGTKIITRPSPDDADKFDPFIGWCVGVVEKLYGGKEKAKRFYKEHAVVQKSTRKVEDVKVEEESVKEKTAYHRCNECKYHKHSGDYDPCKSCISDYIKNNFKTSIGWQPKEQK